MAHFYIFIKRAGAPFSSFFHVPPLLQTTSPRARQSEEPRHRLLQSRYYFNQNSVHAIFKVSCPGDRAMSQVYAIEMEKVHTLPEGPSVLLSQTTRRPLLCWERKQTGKSITTHIFIINALII